MNQKNENENSLSQEEFSKKQDEWFAENYKNILAEIREYEYFKQNNLSIHFFEHKEGDLKQMMCKIMSGSNAIYVRTMEGSSNEVKYALAYFLFRDVFNHGLMLMHKLNTEQRKMEKENSQVKIIKP